MLKIISLYEVPIDLYSLAELSELSISSVEYMCNFFSKNLILEKQIESYSLNEFANKFVLIKYFPNKIETREIREKIKSYQKKLKAKVTTLEEKKRKIPLLNDIMEDWKPKNFIDSIAIAQAFTLYGDAKVVSVKPNSSTIKQIIQDFTKNEKMTSHPYVKFQKARSFELFLNVYKKSEDQKKIIKIISKSFEDAIESTDFYYPYIKNTKSYGSINWLYGLFILKHTKDYSRALRYLEDAIEIYRKLNIKDKQYYTILNNASWAYLKNYEAKKDVRYLIELKKIYGEVLENKTKIINIGFDFKKYRSNFEKFYLQRIK